MADEKSTFLTEVELPPFCFMSEAVEWLAFGRVPQMQHHSDGSTDEAVDYRFYWREMSDNFQPSMEYPWFDPLEFESLGVPVGEDYFRAAEKYAFEDLEHLSSLITEYEDKKASFIEIEGEPAINLWQKLANEYREKILKLEPLKDLINLVETGFKPYREIACAKLFQLLVQDKVQSQAINYELWERLIEDDEYERAGKFENVPSDSYSLTHDWMRNEIYIKGLKHVALRVKTTDILKHRAFLLQEGETISVKRFGAFYISENMARTSVQAKKGRRTVVDWSVINAHLLEIKVRNELPEGKENCIYELIVFAEREFGKTPSRTAVQRNMAAHLDAIYAQK